MIYNIIGTLLLFMALAVIGIMIFGGFQMSIKAVEQDANDNMERRARELADQMYHEALANTHVCVKQEIVVVEDDLT